MARNSLRNSTRRPPGPAAGVPRKSIYITGTLAVLLTLVAGYLFRRPAMAPPLASVNSDTNLMVRDGSAPENRESSGPTSTSLENRREPLDVHSEIEMPEASTAARRATAPETTAPPVPTPESAYARTLVDYLTAIDLSRRSVSPEQADLWKQGLNRLVQERANAVPAIREWLQREVDLDFASVQNGELLGAGSLRSAMFDTLRRIGGPEAINLALEVMQHTTRPDEIARLARDLEEMAPEQYREAAVAAARSALARGPSDPAQPPADASPLFEVLQKFGDATVLSDLELSTKKWNYYGPIVLASLPEGAGIPSLVRIADGADPAFSNSRQFAIRMLAELAPRNADAAQALLAQAGRNEIPNSAWVDIAAALGGEQSFYPQKYLNSGTPPAAATDLKTYHIEANNQNFASVNVSRTWSPEELRRQLALIDQLRAANSAAGNRLQGVHEALAAKLNP